MNATCNRPPRGWRCNKPLDHRGPCPTYPTRLNRLWRWLRGLPR